MTKLFFALITASVLVGALARAEDLVFEQTVQKTRGGYNADQSSFYADGFNGQISVIVSSLWQPPNQPFHFAPYRDYISVPGLSFDQTIGKNGAIVFYDPDSADGASTICAVKGWFLFKDTKNCKIEVQNTTSSYTVRLIIK